MTRSAPALRLVALVVGALLVAGCGSSSKAPSAGERPTDDPASEAEPGAITVTDSRGTVTLDGPATEVVAVEWSYVEDLLALGVTPVGVADIDGYELYVREPAVPEGVTDVGNRQEPSLEEIRLLQPDLIITADDRAAANIDELEDIAPVLTFDEYPAGASHLDAMIDSFTTIATAVGRADRVEDVLAEMDATVAEAAEALDDADLETREIALSQGEGTVEAPMFRLFTDNAMVVELAERVGLENAIEADDQPYGFISVSLEGLTQVGDAFFLPVAPDDAVTEFERLFADSPTWRALEFVQQERFALMGEDTWFFGGPISAQRFVTRLVEALTE